MAAQGQGKCKRRPSPHCWRTQCMVRGLQAAVGAFPLRQDSDGGGRGGRGCAAGRPPGVACECGIRDTEPGLSAGARPSSSGSPGDPGSASSQPPSQMLSGGNPFWAQPGGTGGHLLPWPEEPQTRCGTAPTCPEGFVCARARRRGPSLSPLRHVLLRRGLQCRVHPRAAPAPPPALRTPAPLALGRHRGRHRGRGRGKRRRRMLGTPLGPAPMGQRWVNPTWTEEFQGSSGLLGTGQAAWGPLAGQGWHPGGGSVPACGALELRQIAARIAWHMARRSPGGSPLGCSPNPKPPAAELPGAPAAATGAPPSSPSSSGHHSHHTPCAPAPQRFQRTGRAPEPLAAPSLDPCAQPPVTSHTRGQGQGQGRRVWAWPQG